MTQKKGMLPRRPGSHVMGREAENIFESLLSSHLWLDTKLPRDGDYGLDYRIEFVLDSDLHGCQFFVQLKGFDVIEGE